MRKIGIAILSILFMVACGGTKSITNREEIKTLADEFYKDLETADPITMDSYSDGKLVTTFMKDGEKMYTNQVEAGYDYYMFIKEGTKYLISDDRTLMEDESMYDMSIDTIHNMVLMNVTGYLEQDIDGVTYSATKNGEDELAITVNVKSEEGAEYTISSVGKKENGKVTSISSEMKDGEQAYVSEYKFKYDEHIELPEYKEPVTYNDMPHVDSPYKTFGDIIKTVNEEEDLMYLFYEKQLIVIDSVNGKHYQFSTVVDDETYNAYNELDVMEDDYQQKVYQLIENIEIEDCIDFTDAVLTKEELDAYIGKTIGDMVNDGFEVSGYSFYEESNTVYTNKDLLGYKVDVALEEGFDPDSEFEYEDLYGCTVKGIEFVEPEYTALPMK